VIEHVVRVAAESETALNEVGGLTIRRSLIPRLLVPAQRQRTPPTAAAARLAGWLAGLRSCAAVWAPSCRLCAAGGWMVCSHAAATWARVCVRANAPPPPPHTGDRGGGGRAAPA
jgi:hypothetical protein